MVKICYSGVFIDMKGKYFYEIELGIDKISGKWICKKSRKDSNGKFFFIVREVYLEFIRIKWEYYKVYVYVNYNMNVK